MRMLSRRAFSGLAAGSAFVAAGAVLPSTRARAASPGLKDDGKAPEFTGLGTWINSEPLTVAGLTGKVVLVDFWTYSCYNCVNTLPHVVGWYEKYKDQGLVVVGVHTPEFAYEKITRSVEDAVKKHSIRYPVVQDNNFSTWKAYNNQFWPAFYLVDKRGRVMRQHFGEGEYAEMDAAIQTLIAQPA